MNGKFEMRLSGSGGQGIILASIILAQAAIIAGKHTTQSQSYGPEARGGMCKAEVIISDTIIGFPNVRHPDFILALTQPSLDKFSLNIPEGCLVMTDSSLEVPSHLNLANVISVPIRKTARDVVGAPMTVNIVAVGAINAYLKLFSQKDIKEAVRRHIPQSSEGLNMAALEAGQNLILSSVDADNQQSA